MKLKQCTGVVYCRREQKEWEKTIQTLLDINKSGRVPNCDTFHQYWLCGWSGIFAVGTCTYMFPHWPSANTSTGYWISRRCVKSGIFTYAVIQKDSCKSATAPASGNESQWFTPCCSVLLLQLISLHPMTSYFSVCLVDWKKNFGMFSLDLKRESKSFLLDT